MCAVQSKACSARYINRHAVKQYDWQPTERQMAASAFLRIQLTMSCLLMRVKGASHEVGWGWGCQELLCSELSGAFNGGYGGIFIRR